MRANIEWAFCNQIWESCSCGTNVEVSCWCYHCLKRAMSYHFGVSTNPQFCLRRPRCSLCLMRCPPLCHILEMFCYPFFCKLALRHWCVNWRPICHMLSKRYFLAAPWRYVMLDLYYSTPQTCKFNFLLTDLHCQFAMNLWRCINIFDLK